MHRHIRTSSRDTDRDYHHVTSSRDITTDIRRSRDAAAGRNLPRDEMRLGPVTMAGCLHHIG